MSQMPAGLSAIPTDRYRIERELGQGGMATVYLAQDLKHDRQVALKVLKPELGAVLGGERFLAEIKITARLDHPHILTLLDSGAVDGILYYVLPYVRGESLRVLLNRETQLGIDEALAITRQIASALDYAHRQGVVHRDIKPENIMILEGEAMLTDFGIALAVKEAGGNRLTETGLSLGTPQYMSPEQATGDRQLDARSDLYSLAAVLYEMLTGEPPVTGPTVQAVIAKLITEQPTRVRTVRPTVPEGVDNAVAKALSKVPADRYASPGDFAKALELTRSTAAVAAPAASSKPTLKYAAIAAGAAIVAAVAWTAFRGGKTDEAGLVALRDRTQVTFTGGVIAPAMSADGKQIAYLVKDCQGASCRYAVEVQDVGATASRRVLDGATSGFYVEWSPDRRNLLVYGTVNRRYGVFLVSVNGGAPRHVAPTVATFYAGGDSLLIGQSGTDSAYTVWIASLDGVKHDSLRVPGPGTSLASLVSIPGTTRIVAQIIQGSGALWQVVERNGKVIDRLVNSCTCGAAASNDALWMTRAGPTVAEAVVRVGVDPASGRFAPRQDTVYSGRFSNVSVTRDGSQFLVDDGSYSFSAIATGFGDLMAGRFPSGPPLLQATTPVAAFVSPDGSRLLFRRIMPGANGTSEPRFSVAPFGGGNEVALTPGGTVAAMEWLDSVTVHAGTRTPRGLKLQVIDVRSNASSNVLEVPDSSIRAAVPLPDGWAWIPAGGTRIIVEQGGQRREIPKPSWFSNLTSLGASRDGTRLLYTGWGAATEDTLRLEEVPVTGGTPTVLASSFAERGSARFLSDGSALFTVWLEPESVTLYRVRGPGIVEAVGTVPHVAALFSVSDDLQRASLAWRDSQGDAWLYRVVKPN